MRIQPPILRPAESRLFTDTVLAELRASSYRPRAWVRFSVRCGIRSWEQVTLHPRAAIEITLVHAALATSARRQPRMLVASWFLAITHLGLLGADRGSIGVPNTLSLLRANLPTTAWAPLLAMASDFADGRLARHDQPTAFGAYTDALADVTFWSRFGLARGHPILTATTLAVYAVPAAAITATYFVVGRTIDYPRLVWLRRGSAALQCLIAGDALWRWARQTGSGRARL